MNQFIHHIYLFSMQVEVTNLTNVDYRLITKKKIESGAGSFELYYVILK